MHETPIVNSDTASENGFFSSLLEGRKQFFFEKKKQETFKYYGRFGA